MKTFLKLTVALFAFGFASANAAPYTDLAAAKAAVVAAVNAAQSGNQSDLDSLSLAIANAVGQFPEGAGDIVTVALGAAGTNTAIQNIIVRGAAWTAPNEVASIKLAIGRSSLGDTRITDLKALADRVANAANNTGKGQKPATPPTSVS